MKKIQVSLEYLSDLCLEEDTHQKYNDRDLFNATQIFSHILNDVMFSENQNLPKEKMLELAETVGKAIRQLILDTTDKDMHKIANELVSKK